MGLGLGFAGVLGVCKGRVLMGFGYTYAQRQNGVLWGNVGLRVAIYPVKIAAVMGVLWGNGVCKLLF